MERRKTLLMMRSFTRQTAEKALASLSPRDPNYAATVSSIQSQLDSLRDEDLDTDQVPEYHLRHQKLGSFHYRCLRPLPVGTQVCLHAEIIHDEDKSRLDLIKRMATKEIPDSELLSHTFWLRERPATVRVWISDAQKPDVIYTEATAVFTSNRQGGEVGEKDPNEIPLMPVNV